MQRANLSRGSGAARERRHPSGRLAVWLAAASGAAGAAFVCAFRRGRRPSALADALDARVAVLRQESEQHLRAEVAVAQEGERRRLAGELHDDVIQTLAATNLRLQIAMLGAPSAVLEQLARVAECNADATDRLRTMVFELHPPSLEQLGLVGALASFAACRFAGTPVEFLESGERAGISVATQALAYRVTRELLINVAKHAQATKVTVDLGRHAGRLTVRVHDDGVGFDRKRLVPSAGHIGIALAEDLVRKASGGWSLQSTPGGDTTVEFWVPDTSPE